MQLGVRMQVTARRRENPWQGREGAEDGHSASRTMTVQWADEARQGKARQGSTRTRSKVDDDDDAANTAAPPACCYSWCRWCGPSRSLRACPASPAWLQLSECRKSWFDSWRWRSRRRRSSSSSTSSLAPTPSTRSSSWIDLAPDEGVVPQSDSIHPSLPCPSLPFFPSLSLPLVSEIHHVDAQFRCWSVGVCACACACDWHCSQRSSATSLSCSSIFVHFHHRLLNTDTRTISYLCIFIISHTHTYAYSFKY